MRRKRWLKVFIPVVLVSALAIAIPLASCRPAAQPGEKEPVVIGYIGGFASDWGKCAIRACELFIDDYNAMGGVLGGRPLELVKADSAEDVNEGIKAFDFLAETAKADIIISGSIDDVSLGWLPRSVEHRIPVIDTWTSAIRIIEKIDEDYETYKHFFMSHGNDYQMGYMFLPFAKDVLVDQMGWSTYVMLNEDTAYGIGTAEYITMEVGPFAGIEMLDHIVYDTETVDYAPIFQKIINLNPDFIYWVSSVNTIPPATQYVEQRVPVPIAGINADALVWEYWEDTGGIAAGVSSMGPPPTIGMDHDPDTLELIAKYQARYTDRPRFPHFNFFYTYVDLIQAFAAAEEVYDAGLGSGFDPLDDWVEAMIKQETIYYKDGEVWYNYSWYGPGEVEPITGYPYPHNCTMDPEGVTGMVPLVTIQWYEDAVNKCVYPPKYDNGQFENPWWIAEAQG